MTGIRFDNWYRPLATPGQRLLEGRRRVGHRPPVQAKVVGVPTTLRTLLVSVTDPEALIAACGRN